MRHLEQSVEEWGRDRVGRLPVPGLGVHQAHDPVEADRRFVLDHGGHRHSVGGSAGLHQDCIRRPPGRRAGGVNRASGSGPECGGKVVGQHTTGTAVGQVDPPSHRRPRTGQGAGVDSHRADVVYHGRDA